MTLALSATSSTISSEPLSYSFAKKNQHDTWFYAFYLHFWSKMWPSIHLKLVPVPFEVIV